MNKTTQILIASRNEKDSSRIITALSEQDGFLLPVQKKMRVPQ